MQEKYKSMSNVPNLRFPEFDGEWEVKKLGEVASRINSGKTPLGGDAVYTDEGILFIRSQNVNNDRLELENPVFIPEEINKGMKNSIVWPNDILLNITGASLGRSCVVPEDFNIGNVNQHVCIIRPSKEYNPKFIQPILSSNKGQNVFKSLQTGSGREGLNFESIKNIENHFPSFSEQQKIATFLSLIDERISTQNKIIEELKILKATLSQKIFTQQLRFKDDNGNDFLNWEIKLLGEIATITTGNSNREDSILDGEFTFFDRSQDIRTSNRYLFDKEAVIVPGEGQEFIPKYFIGKFDLHQRTYAIFDFKNIDGKYLFYHILQNDKHLQSQAVGSTVKSLRLPMFETMPIFLPSLAEQIKISTFVSSIDEKMEIEKRTLKQLEQQKKYLLSNLFI
jgi:type I restriction enzyme S subunit